MIEAMRWLWLHYNQLVEPAGAAVIAALPQLDLSGYQHPVALICGGNAAADSVWQHYTNMGVSKGSIPAQAVGRLWGTACRAPLQLVTRQRAVSYRWHPGTAHYRWRRPAAASHPG